MKLTVTVITKNEAANIASALESVSWADEILVIDSHSTDDTVAIARAHGARVEVRDWPGYAAQKNVASQLASNDWILSLDADERVTPELAAEIKALMQAEPAARGYRIPRVTWYLGRWIRTTDWYPDYQLRLFDRRAGRWGERRVHESFELDGASGELRGEIQHYAYRDMSHHLATIDRYTTLAAEQWHAEGRRTGPLGLFFHPRFAFLRNFFLRRGCLDGTVGLTVSILNSYYVFLKLAKLWELQRTPAPGSRTPIPDPRSPIPEPRSPIPEPRSPIPEPRSPIPDPRAPNADRRTPSAERPPSPGASDRASARQAE